MNKQQIDWPSFIASVAIILVTCITLVVYPESGARILVSLYGFISGNLAFMYLLTGIGTLSLLIWLAAGRYGKIRLAASEDEAPEFGDLSWAAMLFCAGVGAGLMYWAPIEWAYYYDAPPYGVEGRLKGCCGVGVQLRYFSLGTHRMGVLLPPHHRDRLPVLCQEGPLPEAQHQLSLPARG